MFQPSFHSNLYSSYRALLQPHYVTVLLATSYINMLLNGCWGYDAFELGNWNTFKNSPWSNTFSRQPVGVMQINKFIKFCINREKMWLIVIFFNIAIDIWRSTNKQQATLQTCNEFGRSIGGNATTPDCALCPFSNGTSGWQGKNWF